MNTKTRVITRDVSARSRYNEAQTTNSVAGGELESATETTNGTKSTGTTAYGTIRPRSIRRMAAGIRADSSLGRRPSTAVQASRTRAPPPRRRLATKIESAPPMRGMIRSSSRNPVTRPSTRTARPPSACSIALRTLFAASGSIRPVLIFSRRIAVASSFQSEMPGAMRRYVACLTTTAGTHKTAQARTRPAQWLPYMRKVSIRRAPGPFTLRPASRKASYEATCASFLGR